ncbi:hypothetical protein [Streptomyces sp. NPDC101393]|uniref:hypothetical protein n=1 Tax=Streptomyces sp. NPDC101393 TaxID=3366141 RepID=UPI003826536C
MVLVVCLLLVGGCAAVVAVFVDEVSDDVSKTFGVTYQVTGDAKDVAIGYSTWRDGTLSTSQATAAGLPWVKKVEAKGLVRGGALTVTLGARGGSATCSVAVDGKEAKTATATGPHATATCSY